MNLATEQAVRLPAGGAQLAGDLVVPPGAIGVVVFAHGSGSSRHSSRNRAVAARLQNAGLATLLLDLLTPPEKEIDRRTRHLRFDIGLLAERLVHAADWVAARPETGRLPIGYFGASTGAGAALVAAARAREGIRAIVSRGGRSDLAGPLLNLVEAPTLLIVGEEDDVVLELNDMAYRQLRGVKKLQVVAGAGHLFEEPGALGQVGELAADWFVRWLG